MNRIDTYLRTSFFLTLACAMIGCTSDQSVSNTDFVENTYRETNLDSYTYNSFYKELFGTHEAANPQFVEYSFMSLQVPMINISFPEFTGKKLRVEENLTTNKINITGGTQTFYFHKHSSNADGSETATGQEFTVETCHLSASDIQNGSTFNSRRRIQEIPAGEYLIDTVKINLSDHQGLVCFNQKTIKTFGGKANAKDCIEKDLSKPDTLARSILEDYEKTNQIKDWQYQIEIDLKPDMENRLSKTIFCSIKHHVPTRDLKTETLGSYGRKYGTKPLSLEKTFGWLEQAGMTIEP